MFAKYPHEKWSEQVCDICHLIIRGKWKKDDYTYSAKLHQVSLPNERRWDDIFLG
jgi:hypothetical protein